MYKGSSDLSHTPVESFSLSIFLSRAPRERRVNERLLMGERGVDTVGCHPSNNIGERETESARLAQAVKAVSHDIFLLCE